jgi:hypothetical protein
MHIMVHDPLYPKSVDLLTLFKESSYISLNVPLVPSTRNLISKDLFEILKSNPSKLKIIINTSRGGVVSESDLREALDSNVITEYITDVFESEPLPADHWLRSHPKVVLSPHIAGKTEESEGRAAEMIMGNVRRMLEGKVLNRVIVNHVGENVLVSDGETTDVASETASGSRASSPVGSDLESDVDEKSESDLTVIDEDPMSKSVSSLTSVNSGKEVIKKAAAKEPQTMRDIFDQLCRPGSDIMNLAAGMVEFDPPTKLREIASEIVLETNAKEYSNIE